MYTKPFVSGYIALLLLLLIFYTNVSAQHLVKISQPAWLALLPSERESIQKKHIVDLVEHDAFGVIIDNQGVDESSGGTVGGANLGGAIANAAYVDKAIRGGNYSAKREIYSHQRNL